MVEQKRPVWSDAAVGAAASVLRGPVPAGSDVLQLARAALEAGTGVDFPDPAPTKYGRLVSQNPCGAEGRDHSSTVKYCDLDAGHLDAPDSDGFHREFTSTGSSLWNGRATVGEAPE